MGIIYRIRCKFDRAYRIRNGWGFNAIEKDREVKALVEFCKEELKDKEHMKLNPDRKKIYKETIRLYECEYHMDDKGVYLIEYINEHIGWYWD